jgi:hypothetical protein
MREPSRLPMLQFPYARHRVTPCSLVFKRPDGLREPACGDERQGTTYTYDNNGNVTSIGSLDYTWDWRNPLASAKRTGGGITTYGYDHTGQRVLQATGSATTGASL